MEGRFSICSIGNPRSRRSSATHLRYSMTGVSPRVIWGTRYVVRVHSMISFRGIIGSVRIAVSIKRKIMSKIGDKKRVSQFSRECKFWDYIFQFFRSSSRNALNTSIKVSPLCVQSHISLIFQYHAFGYIPQKWHIPFPISSMMSSRLSDPTSRSIVNFASVRAWIIYHDPFQFLIFAFLIIDSRISIGVRIE